MLDEPYAGIDPVTVQSIQQIIFKLRDAGISILITDHAALEILSTVDRCYVIAKGTVMCEGTPEEVKQHPEVRKQYLGNLQDSPIASPPGAPNHAKASSSFFEPLISRGEENASEYEPVATAPTPFFKRMSIRRRSESKPDTVEP